MSVSCMGWDVLPNIDVILTIILPSTTTSSGLRGHPRTELAFQSILFLPLGSKMQLPLPDHSLEDG